MKRYLKSTSTIVLLILGLSSGHGVSAQQRSRSYRETRAMLRKLVSVQSDIDKLARLFRIGDRRISDLIQALDDADQNVSLRAQTVIRYLGTKEGMRALYEWYVRQQDKYEINGPVPVPLSEWDYDYIQQNFINRSVTTWRDVEYIYALALDPSPKAKNVLAQLTEKANSRAESTFVGRAIESVRHQHSIISQWARSISRRQSPIMPSSSDPRIGNIQRHAFWRSTTTKTKR